MYARLKEDYFYRVHFHKKDTPVISRISDYVRERIQEGPLGRWATEQSYTHIRP